MVEENVPASNNNECNSNSSGVIPKDEKHKKRRRKRKKRRKKKKKTIMQLDPKAMGGKYIPTSATGCHVAHYHPSKPPPSWIVGADAYDPSEFSLEVRGNRIHVVYLESYIRPFSSVNCIGRPSATGLVN